MSRRNKLLMRALRRHERNKRRDRNTLTRYFGAEIPVWIMWTDAKTGEKHQMEMSGAKISYRTPIERTPPSPPEPFKYEHTLTMSAKAEPILAFLRDLDNL